MTDDRLVREQEFHDTRFAEGALRSADRFWAINRASDRFFRTELDRLPADSLVLDYGCGEGAYAAMHAAARGLSVIAVDLSPVAIEHAREVARAAGVEDRIEFRVMNAEELSFEPAQFDCVCGLGVIHHLDVEASLAQVARVMKPSGCAIFAEPLGHNPAINLYRRLTPSQRTIDEHPLLMSDLAVIRARFECVEVTYFHLLDMLAFPFHGSRFFDSALDVLGRVDQSLFRTPVRRYAWQVGLHLSRPVA